MVGKLSAFLECFYEPSFSEWIKVRTLVKFKKKLQGYFEQVTLQTFCHIFFPFNWLTFEL